VASVFTPSNPNQKTQRHKDTGEESTAAQRLALAGRWQHSTLEACFSLFWDLDFFSHNHGSRENGWIFER